MKVIQLLITIVLISYIIILVNVIFFSEKLDENSAEDLIYLEELATSCKI